MAPRVQPPLQLGHRPQGPHHYLHPDRNYESLRPACYRSGPTSPTSNPRTPARPPGPHERPIRPRSRSAANIGPSPCPEPVTAAAWTPPHRRPSHPRTALHLGPTWHHIAAHSTSPHRSRGPDRYAADGHRAATRPAPRTSAPPRWAAPRSEYTSATPTGTPTYHTAQRREDEVSADTQHPPPPHKRPRRNSE
jgi:hypothetical protein